MRALLVMILVAGCGDNQKLPIGSPCTASSDCGSGKFFCETDHPGGYCKSDCHKDSDCPSGSVCAGAGMVAPGACHKSCNSEADCRAGYECEMAPSDASHAYCDAPEEMSDDGGA